MKTTLLKENLKNALDAAERIIVKSSTLPILGNVLLTCTKNILEISATDLEIGLRYSIMAKNEQSGQVVIPAKHLSQFVALLKEPSVTLRADNGLSVEANGNTTIMRVLSVEDFPIIPALKGDEEFIDMEAAPFAAGLEKVVGVTAQSQTRPEISGVFFDFQPKELILAATDSFRLAE